MTESTKMIKAIANDSKVRIDRIVANYEKLEKENAELKENNRGLDAMLTGESLVSNGLEEQLTKAKEIIKLLLWDLRNRSYEPVKDVERAEQFLSEVEK